jgi:hypothetical protein
MEDILSQGGDGDPSRWPRRLAAITVLLVLAAVAVRQVPHGHSAAAHGHKAATTAGRAPLAGAGSAAAGVPGQPNGVVGPFLPWISGLRLLIAGAQPSWFWPATGRVELIGGLPRDRSGYVFTRTGGGWAVQPAAAAKPGCGGCAGPPLPVYYLADRARSVGRVGAADAVAPAATTGALWLTSYPSGADPGTTAGMAREVSVAGMPLGPRLRLPAGYVIDRATDRGLLLAPVIQPGGLTTYKLWDLAAAKVSRTFSGVLATSAGEIAWTPRCARRCVTHVLDLATGRDTVVALPRDSSAANGAFSPDGDFLALQVSIGSGGDGGGLAMQLEVADVASGHLTVVPGTWASSDALVAFGWPDGGDSLVAELSFTTKVQVASWRPGAARLAVAALRRNQNPTALVVR